MYNENSFVAATLFYIRLRIFVVGKGSQDRVTQRRLSRLTPLKGKRSCARPPAQYSIIDCIKAHRSVRFVAPRTFDTASCDGRL
jgi:hypothetical protein